MHRVPLGHIHICSFATRTGPSDVKEQLLTELRLAVSAGFPYLLVGWSRPEWRMVIACAFLVYKLVQHLDEVLTNKQYQHEETSTFYNPRDAGDEKYDAGYEKERCDGMNGYNHGYGYDDSCCYYDYYETKYHEGYEEDYDAYSSGLLDYK